MCVLDVINYQRHIGDILYSKTKIKAVCTIINVYLHHVINRKNHYYVTSSRYNRNNAIFVEQFNKKGSRIGHGSRIGYGYIKYGVDCVQIEKQSDYKEKKEE